MGKIEKNYFIENVILNCFIIDHDAINRTILNSDDFEHEGNKKIFETMIELATENKKTDLVNLNVRLKSILFDRLNSITCDEYWEQCFPEHLEDYEKSLYELNNKKIVKKVLNENNVEDSKLISQKIEENFKNYPEKKSENITVDIYKELEALSESENKLLGLSSGYNSIDEMTHGFKGGELYIMGARPSVGKSMLMLNMIHNIAKSGKHVYIQALEETKKNIHRRLISRIGNINLSSLMTANLRDDEWSKILDAGDKIKSLEITIDDESGLNSFQISQRIKNINKHKKIDIVFIDHLQEIYDKDQNRHLAISKALNNIKSTTKNLDIPCIVLCQINRMAELRNPPVPYLSDLKESGDIEAKADCVMLLYRPGQKEPDTIDDTMEISFAKSRNGRCGKVLFNINCAKMLIQEVKNEQTNSNFFRGVPNKKKYFKENKRSFVEHNQPD